VVETIINAAIDSTKMVESLLVVYSAFIAALFHTIGTEVGQISFLFSSFLLSFLFLSQIIIFQNIRCLFSSKSR